MAQGESGAASRHRGQGRPDQLTQLEAEVVDQLQALRDLPPGYRSDAADAIARALDLLRETRHRLETSRDRMQRSDQFTRREQWLIDNETRRSREALAEEQRPEIEDG